MIIQPEGVYSGKKRYIDADKMIMDELEAYQAAQMQTEDQLTRKVNYVVHEKLRRLIADTPTEEIEPGQQWIRCSQRVPDNENKVLCLTKTKKGTYGYVLGYYMKEHGWASGMNSNVVAWMPLPAPCEEG